MDQRQRHLFEIFDDTAIRSLYADFELIFSHYVWAYLECYHGAIICRLCALIRTDGCWLTWRQMCQYSRERKNDGTCNQFSL
ncbi:hypothetical protein D3C74_437610 [compost metagenome]